MTIVETNIASLAAKIYARKDWHKLTSDEQALVEMLEEGKYLLPAKNGFVGAQTTPNEKGFIIHLRPDAVIFQDSLPDGAVYDPTQRTLRSETGTLRKDSPEKFEGRVQGGSFWIRSTMVDTITDLEGNIIHLGAA